MKQCNEIFVETLVIFLLNPCEFVNVNVNVSFVFLLFRLLQCVLLSWAIKVRKQKCLFVIIETDIMISPDDLD